MIHHAYIISGDDSEAVFNRALSIALEAVEASHFPHPDISVIEKADGKSELTVDQVRSVISDSIVLPNQSPRKVYIFKDAAFMNDKAQNAALKLLEEPPSTVVLILCSDRADVFLQTVRSRCVEISCHSDTYKSHELSEEFLSLFTGSDVFERYSWLESHNKMSIAEAREFFISNCEVISDILCGRLPFPGLSYEKLMEIEKLMEKCLDYLEVNVNVKQIFGLLEIY